MKKTVFTIALAVVLALSVPLSAFAASSQCLFSPENFHLDYVFVSADKAASWSDPKAYSFTTNDNGSGRLSLTNPFVASTITNWRAKFTPLTGAGNLVVKDYMQFNATFYYQHYAQGNYVNQTITGAMYITAPDGTIYEFPVTDQSQSADQTYFFITVGGTVEVAEGFDFSQCSVEFMFSGLSTASGVTLDFNQFSLTTKELIGEETAKVVESIEKGFADLQEQQKNGTQDIIDNQNQNTQEIIGNQNQNTQEIIGNQNENTDKIINDDLGYETPEENTSNLNAIQTLNSQVNELNLKVEDVKKTIDEGADNFCDGAEEFGGFINSFFSGLPAALIGLIVGLMIFLVLRKVVGR